MRNQRSTENAAPKRVALVCSKGCVGVLWRNLHEIDVTPEGFTDQVCTCGAQMKTFDSSHEPRP